MPNPANDFCANCLYMDYAGIKRFYGKDVYDKDGTRLGWCREASPPPRAFAQEGTYDIVRRQDILGVEWPEVRTDDWCGKWEAAVAKTATGVWSWNNQAPPPISGQVRTDARDWTIAVTMIAIDRRQGDGVDRSTDLAAVVVNDTIQLQHNTDATRWARFIVTAAPVRNGDAYQYTVHFSAAAGTIPTSGTAILITLQHLSAKEAEPAP